MSSRDDDPLLPLPDERWPSCDSTECPTLTLTRDDDPLLPLPDCVGLTKMSGTAGALCFCFLLLDVGTTSSSSLLENLSGRLQQMHSTLLNYVNFPELIEIYAISNPKRQTKPQHFHPNSPHPTLTPSHFTPPLIHYS